MGFTAFQPNAFQRNAFQINPNVSKSVAGGFVKPRSRLARDRESFERFQRDRTEARRAEALRRQADISTPARPSAQRLKLSDSSNRSLLDTTASDTDRQMRLEVEHIKEKNRLSKIQVNLQEEELLLSIIYNSLPLL